MTKHIETKKKIRHINEKATFNAILENAMLSEKEKKLMRMYYIDQHDLGYIADELGYSKIGIIKMHKRILTKIESLL